MTQTTIDALLRREGLPGLTGQKILSHPKLRGATRAWTSPIALV